MSAEVLGLLRATPERLAELAADADPARLSEAPEPGAWSPAEVLAHLQACADVWGGCIARILEEDHPTLRAVSPRACAPDVPPDFTAALRAFTTQRAELLALLEPLPPQAWSRAATVTGAGRPLERTVLSYAQRLGGHERPHVKQIERALRR